MYLPQKHLDYLPFMLKPCSTQRSAGDGNITQQGEALPVVRNHYVNLGSMSVAPSATNSCFQ